MYRKVGTSDLCSYLAEETVPYGTVYVKASADCASSSMQRPRVGHPANAIHQLGIHISLPKDLTFMQVSPQLWKVRAKVRPAPLPTPAPLKTIHCIHM